MTDLLSKELGRPLRVLDLGSAQGYYCFLAAEQGHHATGVDHLPINIAVSRAIHEMHPQLSVDFVEADLGVASELFSEESFDVVFGLSILHHVAHREGDHAAIALVQQLRDNVPFGLFEMTQYLVDCEAEIKRLELGAAVRLVTEYLDHHDALKLLASADVVALPYEATRESSSAALRFVLPVGRPIVTSDLPIFDDAENAVSRVPTPVQPMDLADELEELWLEEDRTLTSTAAARDYVARSSWTMVGRQTVELYDRVMATCPRQRTTRQA